MKKITVMIFLLVTSFIVTGQNKEVVSHFFFSLAEWNFQEKSGDEFGNRTVMWNVWWENSEVNRRIQITQVSATPEPKNLYNLPNPDYVYVGYGVIDRIEKNEKYNRLLLHCSEFILLSNTYTIY